MVWQAIVIVLQILMLSVSWLLFQQARSELNAQAAGAPVLGEVRALQQNVRQLLEEMDQSSERTAVQLESRCETARQLLQDMEQCLQFMEAERFSGPNGLQNRSEGTRPMAAKLDNPASPLRMDRHSSQTYEPVVSNTYPGVAIAGRSGNPSTDRDRVYLLADRGHSAAQIAQEVSMSEGQVETLLGLRSQQRR